MMPDRFDWIFFDCFNTLIDDFDDDGEEHGLCSLPDFAVAQNLFATRTEFIAAYLANRSSPLGNGREILLPERLHRAIASSPLRPDAKRVTDAVAGMIALWEKDYAHLLRPTPDVAAMLAHWAPLKPAGVISNFFLPDEPGRYLERFGLRQHFRFVVDSARFGFKKPHASIFDEALTRAGLTRADASRVLYIGDRVDLDVHTPRELGMQVIHFHRGKTRPRVIDTPPGVKAISSWNEFR